MRGQRAWCVKVKKRWWFGCLPSGKNLMFCWLNTQNHLKAIANLRQLAAFEKNVAGKLREELPEWVTNKNETDTVHFTSSAMIICQGFHSCSPGRWPAHGECIPIHKDAIFLLLFRPRSYHLSPINLSHRSLWRHANVTRYFSFPFKRGLMESKIWKKDMLWDLKP